MQRVSTRLLVSFGAYFLLLLAASGSTLWLLGKQHDDGLTVNLSGRQRMLTQRMTHQLMTYAQLSDRNKDTQAARERVLSTTRVFEVTLDALQRGGPAPLDLAFTQMRDCPPASAAVVAGIRRVRDVYEGYKRAAQQILGGVGAERDNGIEHIVDHNSELLSEMNAVVFLMQAEAEAKVEQLYVIQMVAVGLGFLLSLSLVIMVRTSIARPLERLQQASEELTMRNLHCVVPVEGPLEIRKLAQCVERLRMSLLATLSPRRSAPSAAPNSAADDEFARL